MQLRKLFLDPELAALEILQQDRIGGWSGHLFGYAALESGVFGLQCAEVRGFHP